ncbi:hypothetical protein WJX73_005495 [Symbiochloris irregularis]|uniref:mannan endo-1,4-beta-mannosidase n=1 Tax=Symbiochloris irregularis TaxID=706552 RepID=A0AAW1PDM7_9CHLO
MMTGLKTLCLLAVGAVVLSGAQAQFISVAPGGSGFTSDTCENVALALYQSWECVEAGAGVTGGGPNGLATQFAAARKANLNTVRFNAFATMEGQNLQLPSGRYNATLLVGLDQAIAEAADAGLKIILTLATNWDYTGTASDTKAFYTNLSRTAGGPDDFWTDNGAITAYLAHVKNITSRVNTVNGLAYNEDPAIMAYDLINEGRCDSSNCTATDIQNWIERVAPVVKTYIPRQLLTVGQEGFWQADNCAANTQNPVPNNEGGSVSWPIQTGQNFLSNHAVDAIDFTSVHLAPVNWARTDNVFSTAWLNGHSDQSTIIQKPMILELFSTQIGADGFTQTNSSNLYKLVYAITEASINTDSPIRGIGFQLWDKVRLSPNAAGVDNKTIVSSTSPAWEDTIVPFAGRIANRCPASGPASAPAPAPSSTAASARRHLLQAARRIAPSTTPSASADAPAPSYNPATINSQVGKHLEVVCVVCGMSAAT